ncbi:MAG: amidohydrolase family protein [Verrucomicrobiia bacterium]
MSHNKRLCLIARCVLPVRSPPIENGFVLIEGDKILGIGQKKQLNCLRNSSGCRFIDCGETVVLPSLINSHAHLDYTRFAGKIPPVDSFSRWIRSIIKEKKTFIDYNGSWIEGAEMLLRSGAGFVGNIESIHTLLYEVWGKTPLKILSFLEIIDLKYRRNSDWTNGFGTLIKDLLRIDGKTKSIGLSPHSLYSTTPDLLDDCFALARTYNLPVSIHVAESEEEYEMFKRKSGALYEWLKETGRDVSDCGSGSPVKTLFCNHNPPDGLILAHCNYIDEEDIQIIKKRGASVVHCPSSFIYFGHKEFKCELFLRAGVNVCLGTDSLASVNVDGCEKPTLNMFREMGIFSKKFCNISPRQIIEMATVNGAKAFGMSGKIGELTTGAKADLIGIPFKERIENVYESIINFSGKILFSFIDGEAVYWDKTFAGDFNCG